MASLQIGSLMSCCGHGKTDMANWSHHRRSCQHWIRHGSHIRPSTLVNQAVLIGRVRGQQGDQQPRAIPQHVLELAIGAWRVLVINAPNYSCLRQCGISSESQIGKENKASCVLGRMPSKTRGSPSLAAECGHRSLPLVPSIPFLTGIHAARSNAIL